MPKNVLIPSNAPGRAVARDARQQSAGVDELGPDGQAHGLRIVPAHAEERADPVERARARSRARRPLAGVGVGHCPAQAMRAREAARSPREGCLSASAYVLAS
jgi:hypothetical protein